MPRRTRTDAGQAVLSSPMPTAQEIKQALLSAGFEVYRTRGTAVHIADRVRENLLMDSGIVVSAEDFSVCFSVRAQHSDFPNDSEDSLFLRARTLGSAAIAQGFLEARGAVRPISDPGDVSKTIDTWCEVVLEKRVSDLVSAVDAVRFALTLERVASP